MFVCHIGQLYQKYMMPVFKVWDYKRQTKSMVVSNSMEEIMQKGGAKLSVRACRVVLEEDGTQIDDDEVLMAVQSQTLMLLGSEEQWESASARKPFDELTTSIQQNSVHTESTASCLSTEKPPSICPTYRSSSDDVKLPDFSTFLGDKLASGQAKAVWSKLIDESAHFFMTKYPELSSAGNYKSIGQKMFASYPSIQHEGNEPWSYFNRCLSQKIRHIRWTLKRKSDDSAHEQPKKRCAFAEMPDSVHLQAEQPSSKELEEHTNTIQKEMEKGHPNSAHIRLLLKESFGDRRRWMTTIGSGQLQPIVVKYPCFELGEFVLAEFCMIIKTPLETLQKRAMALLDTVQKMTEGQQGPLEMIDAVLYIEQHSKFDRGKGAKTRSVLTIHEDAADVDKATTTKPLESPHLVIFLHDDTIQQVVVCGDNVKVVFNPTTAVDAFLLLIGVYYAFDLEYPKIYSQVLGFSQQYIVGEKYTGITSSKFHQFTTKYVSFQ